jgi:AcrR family transcriptional regulator
MSTRDRILDAAAAVMRERGVANATTKQIALAAECSEALLYKHFPDKTAMLLAVFRERMPAFTTEAVAGKRTVEENLVAISHGAMQFYLRGFPMMASMVAQPGLLAAFRESLAGYEAGPEKVVTGVADYLRAERELGRISSEADPEAVAALLIGACFQQGFFGYFNGAKDIAKSFAAVLVRGLMEPLRP